jgi:hypothetical protein
VREGGKKRTGGERRRRRRRKEGKQCSAVQLICRKLAMEFAF